MSSIVFFGKAHAGKSTLVGSLIAHNEELDLERLDSKFGFEIPNYDPSTLYSAIVDDTQNERMRRVPGLPGGHAPGSTRTRHYRNIALFGDRKVTVIDTPGAEHLNKERDRGMFAGDVGVFCLEANDVANEDFLAKDEQYRTVLRTLALWSGLARAKVIVALTKMDEPKFDEAVFERACSTIRQLCGGVDLSVEFVPTAIVVRSRETHNVLGRSPHMGWYNGRTLADALQAHLGQRLSSGDRSGSLLFSVDRQFDRPRSRVGRTWQVKVLSGVLRKGQRVVLAPVSDSNHEFLPISAEVKALHGNLHRSENTEELEEVGPGGIVGLDLRSVASRGGRGMSKDDFNTLYTTCGFDPGASFAMSSSFEFSVPLEHAELFIPGRQFGLIWFGRNLEFQVRGSEPWREAHRVSAGGLARPIAMPRGSATDFVRDTLLIRNRTGRGEDFIRARLLDID